MNPSSTTDPRVVVVIGGASGIGLATAERFARDGATVVVADLDGDLATTRARELGGRSWAHQVRITDDDAVDTMFDLVGSRSGRVDAVVNCAGTSAVAPLTGFDADDWRRVVDVCLTGAFLVIKHTARRMDEYGSIVTIASLNATQPAAGMAAYCAAKAGVVMLTQVAALELGPQKIRVNAVSPGLVDTPLVAPLLRVPGLAEEFTDNTPLGRSGIPEDVANAVHFLSTRDSWITGETLTLDGDAHTRRYPDVLAKLTAGR